MKTAAPSANVLDLKYIVENELFITAQLLTTDRFMRYCKERGVRTSKEQLEQFERLRLFFPIARVRFPLLRIKVEYSEDRTQYTMLDILNRGETWDGDVVQRYADFSFAGERVKDWLKRGRLWDPVSRPFTPWKTFYDKKRHHNRIESYYSIFQVYELWNLLRWTEGLSVRPEWWVTKTEAQIEKTLQMILITARQVIASHQEHGTRGEKAPLVCQAISNRYYWHTQTDRRTIRTSLDSKYYDWDWRQYIHEWNPHVMLSALSMTTEEVKKLYELISMEARHVDPLEQWHELVSFIALDKKKKLKGEALLAQDLYAMSDMLKKFYRDLTTEDLHPPHLHPDWSWDNVYGEGVTQNELLYLELLTNEYHLNPRPKLVLVVEGDGEEQQFPRLVEQLFGYTFAKLGIELVKLGGVGNFTGKKPLDRYGALKRFIDNYHFKQTIVVVVLDQEGDVARIKQKLVSAKSDFYPGRRVTKEEYVHLWQKNIEFDNFSDVEIARAMTEAGQNKYLFSASEIADCRARFGGRSGDTLSKLFNSKLPDRDLDKPELLEKLSNLVIANGANEFDENDDPKRPFIKLLLRIIRLASMNHQPVTFEVWRENQESGYFGELIGDREQSSSTDSA